MLTVTQWLILLALLDTHPQVPAELLAAVERAYATALQDRQDGA